MKIVIMSKGGQREEPAAKVAIQIAGVAAKVGLYIGTVIISAKAVIKAAEVAQGRLAIPGGEIFTIPLIVALLLVGWALRGDVERAQRKCQKNQRRGRQNDRRI